MRKRIENILGLEHSYDIPGMTELYDDDLTNLSKIYGEIYNIINGEVIYSDNSADFEYIKEINRIKHNIKSINTATGIKSFGIIQLLIKSGVLNNRTVLIIDEPEVHLHPEWQLKYAHIMVKLVKYGIPVVISSHSPYMIQALRYYSVKEGIDDISKYYLAEKDENELVEIKDVGDDLNRIFSKLARPFKEIVWGI
jgi:predicted ATPase